MVLQMNMALNSVGNLPKITQGLCGLEKNHTQVFGHYGLFCFKFSLVLGLPWTHWVLESFEEMSVSKHGLICLPTSVPTATNKTPETIPALAYGVDMGYIGCMRINTTAITCFCFQSSFNTLGSPSKTNSLSKLA